MSVLKKYKARIICTTIFVLAIVVWDSIYYFGYEYPINPLLDITYTLAVAIVVWWLASFYDKSDYLIKSLKKSEDNFKQLLDTTKYVFNNLNQVVYRTDRIGNFTLLNPAWEEITGFTVNETIGQNINYYIYHEDQNLAAEMFFECVRKKQEIAIEELRFRRNGGGYVWIEKNLKINYDINGNVLSTLGTFTDITERKQNELQLRQLHEDLTIRSEKLSVVAQLSAAIAHEVRNPLTSISGFLQLLKERKNLKQEYIDVIFSEIERIETVLSELLLLSKPQVVTFKHFNLSKSLDYVITLLRSNSNMYNIEIQYNKPDEPVEFYGEENQIKQVFINIIKNAIEALPNGGKITICEVVCEHHVSVYIKDNGPGIPEDILNKVGQPFYTTKEKGTGLGLTTCFKIIETHKGHINISSTPDSGTTFEISLPLSNENQILTKKSVG